MRVVNVCDYGGVDRAVAEGVRYVGRPGPLGNPFTDLAICVCTNEAPAATVAEALELWLDARGGLVRVASRGLAVEAYRLWLWDRIRARDGAVLDALGALGERDLLGCWCHPLVCHAGVVVRAWAWCKGKGFFPPK